MQRTRKQPTPCCRLTGYRKGVRDGVETPSRQIARRKRLQESSHRIYNKLSQG